MSVPNAETIYAEVIQQLPSSERLRLAAMILERLLDVAAQLDYSEQWTDQDIQEFVAFSQRLTDKDNGET